MPESAARQLLGPLIERSETLDKLVGRLICKLGGPNEMLPNKMLYAQEYADLAAEQARAVLAYRKIAEHWPPHLKKQVQNRLETVLHSYAHLNELLGARKNILEQRMQNMQSPLQQKGRNRSEAQSRLLDFEC